MSLLRPSGKLSRLVDPSQKIFEGEVMTTLYDSGVVSTVGRCWHCKSNVYLELELTPGEARQAVADAVFKNNIIEREKDRLQEMHQCGALLHDGKDVIDDVWRDMNRRQA